MTDVDGKKTYELETAIISYLDNNNKNDILKYKGKVKGLSPFGEYDLGNVINNGNITEINETLKELSTVSFAENVSPNTERLLKIVDNIDKLAKGKGANNFIKVMKYIMTSKKKNKSLKTIPSSLAKVINQTDWDFLVYGCKAS